jgi:choline dehydrogenase-like flavoprotein
MEKAKNPEPVDVCIVGAGASGATAAKVLAEAGLKVVVLERGPWLRPEHFSGDELKNLNRNYVWPNPVLNPRTFRPNDQIEAEVMQFSNTPQGVGAGTLLWGAMFPRMAESDFKLHTLHGDVDGASVVDWPFEYAELEPYYSKVEWEFGTAGLAGANKWEGPRSRPYPTPPVPLSRIGRLAATAMAKLGISSFPMPHAMVTQPYRGREPFWENGFWQQYPDPGSGKSSTANTFIPDALATGNLELRTEALVREVTLDERGRARGVVYEDEAGRTFEQRARVVILGCGAIETTRLLLLSTSSMFPHGLANSSGLVGKFATFHQYLFSVGLFDRELADPLFGWSGHYMNLCTFDFYETDIRRGHMLGCPIFPSMLGHPINWTYPGRPTWGQPMKDADRELFNHSMKVGALLHDLAVETNQVDLDPTVRDAWGMPVARITHTPHANDFALANWTVAKGAEILDAAGAAKSIPVYMDRITGNTCHQHGTARMGNDPSTSVVDRWGGAHDVPGLFIVDGSVFPTSTGVNPTLSIMANAWRSCDHIVELLRTGADA